MNRLISQLEGYVGQRLMDVAAIREHMALEQHIAQRHEHRATMLGALLAVLLMLPFRPLNPVIPPK
jgi:hypothetical protein